MLLSRGDPRHARLNGCPCDQKAYIRTSRAALSVGSPQLLAIGDRPISDCSTRNAFTHDPEFGRVLRPTSDTVALLVRVRSRE